MLLLKQFYKDEKGWHVLVQIQHPYSSYYIGLPEIWDSKQNALLSIECQAWIHASSYAIQYYKELSRVWDGKMTPDVAKSMGQLERLKETIKTYHMEGKKAMGWFLACGEDWNRCIPPVTIYNSMERKHMVTVLRHIKQQYTDLLQEFNKPMQTQFENNAATAA